MKNHLIFFKKTALLFSITIFSMLSFGNSYAYAQKKAQVTVINNGKHEITFYKVEGKQRGSATGVNSNQRISTQHTIGSTIEVMCKGKKIDTFYISADAKKNKFTVVCD